VTGFDIIFFWVARMIMAGLKLTDKIPFAEIYITGLIRDAHGQKMSKSKGNVLDPIDLIDGIDVETLVQKRTQGLMQPEMLERITRQTRKEFADGIKSYGADALRFTFCALASTSRDINFSFGRLEGCRNFCNKLWNATRFVLQKVEGEVLNCHSEAEGRRILSVCSLRSFGRKLPQDDMVNRWILSRLQKTIEKVHQHFASYRFDLLAQELYDFTWHEYCDWYLELTKPILAGDNKEIKAATRYTLIYVLETLLRLLHPIIPFVTEELWQTVAPLANVKGKTIMLAAYPEFDKTQINEEAEKELEWIKKVVVGIRTIRSEMNVAPGKKIPVLLNQGTQQDKKLVAKHELSITTLAKLESINWLEDVETKLNAATALVGEMEILIPLAGLIDVAEETARLNKEIAKLEKELEKIKQKLQNKNFIAKAPENIVAQEQQRQNEVAKALAKLQGQLKGLL
jgi:valyl-tRNA synthetase